MGEKGVPYYGSILALRGYVYKKHRQPSELVRACTRETAMEARTERKAVRFKALLFFFVCALATALVYALKCSLHSGAGARRTSVASAALRKSGLWSRSPRKQRKQLMGPVVCSMTMAPATTQSTGGPGKWTRDTLACNTHTFRIAKYVIKWWCAHGDGGMVCRSGRHRRAIADEDA